MDNSFPELDEYIEERIQGQFFKLKNNKEYLELHTRYVDNYEILFNKLNKTDRALFENICNDIFNINSKENYLSYKVGFVDGIKLNDFIEKNRN